MPPAHHSAHDFTLVVYCAPPTRVHLAVYPCSPRVSREGLINLLPRDKYYYAKESYRSYLYSIRPFPLSTAYHQSVFLQIKNCEKVTVLTVQQLLHHKVLYHKKHLHRMHPSFIKFIARFFFFFFSSPSLFLSPSQSLSPLSLSHSPSSPSSPSSPFSFYFI